MKVCGKRDVLVPECSDCSELEERVDAVEECCDNAHDEIDTLTTDKADKTYVDDSIDNVNQTIADVADTLGERIDNVITASDPSVTTLWEGVLEQVGDTVQLSQDVNDFDYLDIYYRTSVDESEGYYNNVRIPADQFANYIITVGGTLSPLGESPNIAQYLTQVSFVDDTATIDNIREWSWNGSQSTDAADDPQALMGVSIYRIDGIVESGCNLEIADAREGVDGTIYPSLGDAIREQIQDTRDMIQPCPVQDVQVNGTSVVDAAGIAHITMPELVKTVNGNPIVLDDAFGEVKNLDVELLPIQEGSGAPSPQNVRPITGHDSVQIIDTGTKNQTQLPTKQGYWAGTNGALVTDPNWVATDKTPCLANTQYHISSNSQWYRWVAAACYDANGSYIGTVGESVSTSGHHANVTITTLPLTAYIGISLAKSPSNSPIVPTDVTDLMLEIGNTASAYEPYHGQSKTVTLPHTVYGAGVGVTSGEGKEKWGTFAIGDESATDFGTSALGIPYLDLYKPIRGGQDLPTICTEYEQIPAAGTGASGVFKNFASAYTIYDTRFTSASQAKALLESEGFLIAYTLETPTDLTTTPTDLTLYNGDNVVSSDGDMELTYVQDMAIVIRKIESQL